VAEGIADEIAFIPSFDHLRLDPKNPRLPLALRDGDQEDILRHIAGTYEPILVGRSIARYSFFPSEPLIVVEESGEDIVVEGNRRLVALKLLTDPDARELVADPEWEKLAGETRLPEAGIPIVRAVDRDAVAPIIGYRHIAGIQEWDPLPKSRFITDFIDGEDELSFAAVSELVGESEGDVRRLYRNFSIVQQARGFGLDTSRAEADFGVFDRAVVGGVRAYIGAPAPSQMSERTWPLEETDTTKDRLREVLAWIYGTESTDAVIKESRDLSKLSKVLRSEDGTTVLKATGSLAEADLASGGPRARLIENLGTAVTSLKASRQDIADHTADKEVRKLLATCSPSAGQSSACATTARARGGNAREPPQTRSNACCASACPSGNRDATETPAPHSTTSPGAICGELADGFTGIAWRSGRESVCARSCADRVLVLGRTIRNSAFRAGPWDPPRRVGEIVSYSCRWPSPPPRSASCSPLPAELLGRV
jgi:hypothetical protein